MTGCRGNCQQGDEPCPGQCPLYEEPQVTLDAFDVIARVLAVVLLVIASLVLAGVI